MRWVAEVAPVDKPDENADGRNDLCEHVAKVVQLLLQRRRLRDLRSDALVDVSNGRVSTSQNNQRSRVSRDDGGTGEQHVDLILLDSARILDRARVLGHTLALTGQDRLVNAEAVALDRQDPAVCGNPVTDCNRDDVSRHQVVGLDAGNVSSANDLGLVGRVFLEGGDGLFGACFLRYSDDGVEDENGENLVELLLAHGGKDSSRCEVRDTYDCGIHECGPALLVFKQGKHEGHGCRA